MKMVALIPARVGSKRVPGKNMKLLAGQPLIDWTIAAAIESGVFADICVVTDMRAGVRGEVRVMRRSAFTASDDAPDILWVREFFEHNRGCDAFAILRPTSPFRTAETIRRAFAQFQTQEVHSIRAVQPVKEHPGKMWQCAGPGYPMVPLIDKVWPSALPLGVPIQRAEDRPWHSMPTQALPPVYVQNASLEMAWSFVVPAFGTISGRKVAPFFTHGYEGYDLNTMDDWREAERLIAEGLVELPPVSLARVS